MENNHLKNLFFYMSIPIIRVFVNFGIIPVLTLYLSEVDYGLIGLLTVVYAILSTFYLGLNSTTVRFFCLYKGDKKKLKQLISTNLFVITIGQTIISALLYYFFDEINRIFLDQKLTISLLMLGSFSYFFLNLVTLFQTLNKFLFKAKLWAFVEFIGIILMPSVSLYLVIFKKMTFEALIYSPAIVNFVLLLILIYCFRSHFTYRISFKSFVVSVKYSWPMVFATLIGIGGSYIDKIILGYNHMVQDVGNIEIGNKLSNILKIFIDALGGSLSPYTLKCLDSDNDIEKSKLVRYEMKFLALVIFVGLGISFFTEEVVFLLTHGQFEKVKYFLPMYIYYYIFSGLGAISYWRIYRHNDKTYYKMIFSILYLVINVCLTIILIPRFGVYGAAFATLFSTMIVKIISHIIACRLTPTELDNKMIVILLSFSFFESICLYLVLFFVNNLYLKLVFKIVLLLLYIFFILKLQIFTFLEMKQLRKQLFSKTRFKS